VADDASLRESDAICSALQLINFWQDVAVDIGKGRIYLPLEDLARFQRRRRRHRARPRPARPGAR
jgi:phytoene/squalene synthetase